MYFRIYTLIYSFSGNEYWTPCKYIFLYDIYLYDHLLNYTFLSDMNNEENQETLAVTTSNHGDQIGTDSEVQTGSSTVVAAAEPDLAEADLFTAQAVQAVQDSVQEEEEDEEEGNEEEDEGCSHQDVDREKRKHMSTRVFIANVWSVHMSECTFFV